MIGSSWKTSPIDSSDENISPLVSKLTPRNPSSIKSVKIGQTRKASYLALSAGSPTHRDKGRSLMFPKFVRTFMGKRFIVVGASILAALSIIMLFQTTRVVRESSFLRGTSTCFPNH